MFPYLILIGVPAFLSFISKRVTIKDAKGNITISSFFIIFLAILSLRGLYIGNDTSTYKLYYEFAMRTDWSSLFKVDVGMEKGYVLLEKIVSSVFPSYQWFIAIVSLIAIVPLWIFYKNDEDSSFITLVMFLVVAPFSMYFSGLRQIIAMAFMFPAYKFARNKKLLWFLLTVAVAFMFHKSAFVIIFLYLLCNINIRINDLWMVIPVIGITFLFNKEIFMFLGNFVTEFYTVEIDENGAYTVLMLLVAFMIYSYIIPDNELLDDETLKLRNILIMCVCLQCFAPVHSLAMRLNYYYLPFVPVAVTKIINRSNAKNQKIAELSSIVITLAFVGYFFYNTASGGGLNIYPYKTFWS